MTDRKTASTITDIELDQLYRERDALRRMLNPDDLCLVDEMVTAVEQHMNRADRAEAEIAACRRQQWPQRLGRAEAAIKRVRALHREEYGCCSHCTRADSVLWPCPTISALDEPAPAATNDVKVLGTVPISDGIAEMYGSPAATDGQEQP